MVRYGCDFGDGDREVLEAVCRYIPDESKTKGLIEAALGEGGPCPAVKYAPYDWSLNKS